MDEVRDQQSIHSHSAGAVEQQYPSLRELCDCASELENSGFAYFAVE
jgi:hypothetical protein